MKKGLTILLFPFLWLVGALSILSGNSNSMSDLISLKKDMERDSSYDGQAMFNQIEGIKS
ncbi:hypothetical protein ABIE27_000604 [Paenibacillus sp. 4624]|jgi:hypothetical protein|uniref:Uncharacterized protein n=1 Tax=Paenibacillus amylolyticus TaxID=1451 RepID=A0A5M9WM01_PAEAM|nr:hypothetical protein [Paenibacillus amylolyticus]KAA8782593.1 hypothetical protein EC604_01870 [Paenibacillus amylolyticus]